MSKSIHAFKIEGWTKEDIYDLLVALKAVFSFDIEKLKEHIPNKSEDEIRAALDVYRKAASSRPTKTTKKKEPKVTNQQILNLSQWAKFLLDAHGHEELQTETAAALRLIADFEDRPPAKFTENIDFQKLYHMLADVLEGKPLQEDKLIMAIINKCMEETVLTSKGLLENHESLKKTLSGLDPSGSNMNTIFSQLNQNNELFYHRKLSLQKNYNPLNIPEDNLKLP